MKAMTLKESAENYYTRLSNLMGKIQATREDGSSLDFFAAAESVAQLAMAQTLSGKKIIFIGSLKDYFLFKVYF